MACGAISESSPVRNAEALVARRAREAPVGLACLSEKQYQAPAGLARNCRFSQSASRRSTGRVRRSSGAPSDLINGTEYHSSEALDRVAGVPGQGSDQVRGLIKDLIDATSRDRWRIAFMISCSVTRPSSTRQGLGPTPPGFAPPSPSSSNSLPNERRISISPSGLASRSIFEPYFLMTFATAAFCSRVIVTSSSASPPNLLVVEST